MIAKDGTFYVWGKNDRGQLGTGTGIGIDMIESENQPIEIIVGQESGEVCLVKDFTPG